MRVIYIIVLLCFTQKFLFAQGHLLKTGKIEAKQFMTTIDFVIEQDKIILPVIINGTTYRFLFDTGAPNALNEKSFPSSNKVASIPTTDSNNKTTSLIISHIPTFSMGDLVFSNFHFLQYDFSKNYIINCFNLDGIIGSNSFKNAVIKIDYANKKLIISDNIKSLNNTLKPTKMAVVGDQKAPYITIQLKGKEIIEEQVLFDTGYNGFYMQSQKTYEICKKAGVIERIVENEGKVSVGLFGGDAITQKAIFTVPSLHINNTEFTGAVCYNSNDNNSKVGMEMLKNGIVILDFKKKHFYYESSSPQVSLAKPYPLYVKTFDQNQMIIGMVVHPKLQNSLKVGDVLVNVDGKYTDKMDCELLFNIPDPRNRFVVRKENQEQMEFLVADYKPIFH